MSRLSIFQAYDYYHVKAASIEGLTPAEKVFISFCMDNHETICDEESKDNDPILIEATKLYDKIMDEDPADIEQALFEAANLD